MYNFKNFLRIRHLGNQGRMNHTVAYIQIDGQGQNWLIIPCMKTGIRGCKGYHTTPTRFPVPADLLRAWIAGVHAKFEINNEQEGRAA